MQTTAKAKISRLILAIAISLALAAISPHQNLSAGLFGAATTQSGYTAP